MAAAAAVTALLALSAGALWFLDTLSERFETGATMLANAEAASIGALLERGIAPENLTAELRAASVPLFEIVNAGNEQVAACPDNLAAGTLYRAGREGADSPSIITLDLSWERCNSGFDGYLSGAIRASVGSASAAGYRIYVAARVDPYGQLPAIRTQVWVAVPVISALIAATAWLAARRALRPVERVRAEVAEITARDLSRRVPVPGTGDELTVLAVTMNDMLARLRDSADRQRRFVADASHELRTPLASMRTQLEVLLTYPDRIDWRETVMGTVADVARLQDLVADLLVLARSEDGDRRAAHGPVAMDDVVRDCLRGREVQAELADVVVRGHPAQLERLVGNLLDNAERHARSAVMVTLSADDGECLLAVSDDGPGIPARDRDRVFDRFVRLDEDRDRDDGGAGLGLAIAAEIVAAHHGRITVEDSAPGARFVVRLPLIT
ncbi:sensor histidine kinase [Amycolatopsis taiwanensis]|uniref:histidine kinase n=1 Tax=Amycolatopsis taiwanensis TaxID=342230 RepID=A0A9W6R7X6_9PSEU|nr:ATP-binding protein [Amycolatopsis taiwanensis]GLY70709.1 two-component sensor histidine kinase [Amycolatopsis taiwanensis]